MGSCVFVASGLDFRMDDFLRGSCFRPLSKFYKGDVPPKDNPHRLPRPDSGFVHLVSQDANDHEVAGQMATALTFLGQNEKEIGRLKQFGADNFLLDFGFTPPSTTQHSVYLPPELIAALGRFEMGLILSVIQIGQG
jgi:hypothetical protein